MENDKKNCDKGREIEINKGRRGTRERWMQMKRDQVLGRKITEGREGKAVLNVKK